jgi:hypothetical protein
MASTRPLMMACTSPASARASSIVGVPVRPAV